MKIKNLIVLYEALERTLDEIADEKEDVKRKIDSTEKDPEKNAYIRYYKDLCRSEARYLECMKDLKESEV